MAQEKDNFLDKAFNSVDSLVLSQFSYLNLNGLVPDMSGVVKPVSIGEITHKLNHNTLTNRVRDSESNLKLLHALANSPRFSNTKITFYVEN